MRVDRHDRADGESVLDTVRYMMFGRLPGHSVSAHRPIVPEGEADVSVWPSVAGELRFPDDDGTGMERAGLSPARGEEVFLGLLDVGMDCASGQLHEVKESRDVVGAGEATFTDDVVVGDEAFSTQVGHMETEVLVRTNASLNHGEEGLSQRDRETFLL